MMYRQTCLILLLALVYVAASLPVANPAPIVEPVTLYVRDEAGSSLKAREAEAIPEPVLPWTWFNGGHRKDKREPVLPWTWFNGGHRKDKREPVLPWTWFNGGHKKDKRSPVLPWTWFNGGH